MCSISSSLEVRKVSANQIRNVILTSSGGASGSILAYRLAKLLPNHSVLLLEAGGDNADEKYRTFRERYFALMTPGYNWGYKTIPQSNLKDREIDYSRGKGLGGSSAINFCVYTRGSKADYDHWAELVGDEQWKWDRALERFKGVRGSRIWSTVGRTDKQIRSSTFTSLLRNTRSLSMDLRQIMDLEGFHPVPVCFS